jgi:hypothetical protein
MKTSAQSQLSLSPSRRLAIALWCLIGSFVTLVPGGPIETRDFSHLSPTVFWGFNIFLAGLGLVGLGGSYGAWRGRQWAAQSAIPVAWLYLGVFILDWAQVFPTTPDPMGLGLALVELFGAICSTYSLVFAHRVLAARHEHCQ